MLETDPEALEHLRVDYNVHAPSAQRLIRCLEEQLATLLQQHGITLGVPMETRVKTWESISEKLKRKALQLSSVCDLADMAGVRLILLFRDDLDKMDGIIRGNLDVISGENTADRLDDTQFGYQSNHYVIRIPEHWEELPSYTGLRTLTAEIQVRTVAQHIWAAASHKLQYKREASVPPALRRTIHRVSALLETVDLEFSRVLAERDEYIASVGDNVDVPLNVDSLIVVLPELLPPENKFEDDDYDELLVELGLLGISTSRQLETLIAKQREAVLAREKEVLDGFLTTNTRPGPAFLAERVDRGVYFTLCGLTRIGLRFEFGADKVDPLLAVHHTHTHPRARPIDNHPAKRLRSQRSSVAKGSKRPTLHPKSALPSKTLTSFKSVTPMSAGLKVAAGRRSLTPMHRHQFFLVGTTPTEPRSWRKTLKCPTTRSSLRLRRSSA